ncbi:MAG: carbohydrate ABC transporter permease, partial [Clostridia bacterium]|nr:carbohydrate ABC transporter permease [Clostridia bacterium]
MDDVKKTTPQTKKMIESSGPVGQNATLSSRIFDVLNYVIVSLVAITTILPFIYIIGASFATEYEIATRPMFIIPQDTTLNAYRFIFSSNKILQGFGNSIFITVCGTAINLFCTVTMAYALSKTRLRGRNFFLNLVIFSMFFSGGMIPGYIVVANILNLKNTYWSVLLPGAISAYNMMIVKNFFQG